MSSFKIRCISALGSVYKNLKNKKTKLKTKIISRLKSELPVEAKAKKKWKFSTKFIMWQAISQEDRASEPFITASKINSRIYLS